MPQLLPALPVAYYTATHTYRYYVELASTQLDFDGVPEFFCVVDVVAVPTQEAIIKAIFDCEFLKGYELISYWIPEDEAPF